jgi:hypothetical protein
MISFEEWLVAQKQREDLVGDLARELHMQKPEQKPSRRKHDEHREWVEIVVRMPEPRYVPVFNEAWQEFLLANKAVDDAVG